jgi:cobalt-zinc-cadmium efflux system protein
MSDAHDHPEHDHSAPDRGKHDQCGHGHHGHSPGGHSHAPANFGRSFLIGIALNAAFVVAEVVFGLAGHSVALLADAGHNLSDVLGLVVAWTATVLARRAPTARFTYGFGGSSILAALFNAVFLLLVIGGLSWEAIGRLSHPEPVAGKVVMIVAAGGIVINGICAWLFISGRKGDLNVRGAFIHMAADALVSVGVVAAGFVILMTGWLWLDPVVSLAINAVIVLATWSLLRDSVAMSMNSVPKGLELIKIDTFLASRPGIAAIHDLHVWSMSTTDVALTVHAVMPGGHPGDPYLGDLCRDLQKRFGIGHATIQVEIDEMTVCALAPAHVV